MKKILLVDGNALMHRAYHAMPPLTTSHGEQVNAVFGFTSLLLRALSELQPEYVALTFDRAAPTFRHTEFAAYKATRQKMDADLANQIPRLKQVAQTLGFPIFELDGFEADDLIGTLTRQAYEGQADLDVYIMTADMDAAQLVNERVKIYTAKQKISEVVTYDIAGIKEKFGGLEPSQIVDYKALRGDASDNIPGVAGIGEKTAIELLLTYRDLDSLYANLDKLKERPKMLLQTGRDSAYLSKKIATIDTHAPIQLDLPACHIHQLPQAEVIKLFQELEFKSLISRLPQKATDVSPASQQAIFSPDENKKEAHTDYQLVSTSDSLIKILERIASYGQVAFDTETTGLEAMNSELVGVSLSIQAGQGFYVPFAEWSKEPLKKFFENSSIQKIAHHAKFDQEALEQAGILATNITFDTMLAAYILKEGIGKYGLKDLAFQELGIVATPISSLIGIGAKKITIDKAPLEDVAQYASADADHTWQLYQIFSPQLEADPPRLVLFQNLEMPTSAVLARMEQTGIKLDVALLKSMSSSLGQQLHQLELDIYAAVGHEFNLNSPKQLGDVLFDELHLPVNKKTKTGRSTDESVLQAVKDAHPVVKMFLSYRELYKLKSTYVDALPALISPRSGRLHTSYNQAIASTGRLSSSNPNLQNIPIRGDVGRKIRQAFIPDPGHILLAADYSQVELRLLAHVSNDRVLLEAFRSGQDIHAATAAKVFNCAVDEVTKDQRRAAKTINFGIMYGQSAHGLSQQLGISREAATTFIADYFAVYTGVKNYLKDALVKAHRDGYVETLFDRRRQVPELASSNFQLRQAGERMAINMPIQGTAADIIKRAMVSLHTYFQDHGLQSKMLLQVHDELVFTVYPEEKEEVSRIIFKHMEQAADLQIPLVVEAKVGPNWGEMVQIERAEHA